MKLMQRRAALRKRMAGKGAAGQARRAAKAADWNRIFAKMAANPPALL